MFGTKPRADSASPKAIGEYARHKTRMSERQRKLSRDSREISGDFPACQNPARRKRALARPRIFLRTYFPGVFYLDFSDDQTKVLNKAETAVREGGQFALAMPRSSGKTAILVAICIWAILSGFHEVVMLICASKQAGIELLDGIKVQLATNDMLLADFPEVCYPIRRLDGVAQRRLLWKGELIRQEATKEKLVLPSLPPSPAASACIVVRGITGRIRGFKFTRPDGREVRPSLALIDDPQTSKSAKSLIQCDVRERIINGDVLGLAGPDKAISAIMCCTVIYPDDLADRMLDKEKNPQWRGERMRMVYEWAKGEAAERLWEEYGALWREANAEDREPKEATALYRTHRKLMDQGSRVAWPQRRYPGTISALQHAYNLRLKMGRDAFDAEYQNSPRRVDADEGERLDPDAVANRFNRLERFIVPVSSAHLVAFIDVNDKVLAYVAAAVGSDFSGDVIDYGSYPDQGRPYWTKEDAERCYADELPKAGREAQIYNALDQLTDRILGREWKRDGGASVGSIGRCLIDANWGLSTDVVYQFCRESKYRSILTPSHGRGIKASDRPLNQYQRKPGDIVGVNWRSPVPEGNRRAIRHIVFDTNYWKSFAEARFKTPPGSRGCWRVYGDSAGLHRMFADHMTSEARYKVTARGRTVDEWKPPRPGNDNEMWDCVVGCCVAAAREGANLLQDTSTRRPARPQLEVTF